MRTSWRPSSARQGSPGHSDPAPPVIPSVVVEELLAHTELPLRDAVELHNLGPVEAQVGGWYLTDDFLTPAKYKIAAGVSIPAGGFLVLNESQFNPAPGVPPSFSFRAQGDEVFLFSADLAGQLTGYLHGFKFGASESGVSFGRYLISTGVEEFVAQTETTLGGTNAGPKVGPVVLSEVMYHPPDLAGGADNELEEYVELHNLSANPVSLFDPAFPEHTWHLSQGVTFGFATNQVLGGSSYLLVVNFNPSNTVQLAAFRNRYGLGTGLAVVGPYGGKLNNGGEAVALEKPDRPVGTEVPYVLVDRVKYEQSPPWPEAADGGGASLQRVAEGAYGNDPVNWRAAWPSPGRSYAGGSLPVIMTGLVSQTRLAYTDTSFSVQASGPEPLGFQWRRNGRNLPGATASTLALPDLSPDHAGTYTCLVYNQAGSIETGPAELTVLVPAKIELQPANQGVKPGATAKFTVVASSTGALTYQWRRDGQELMRATNTTLSITNAQVADEGNYTVVVSNLVGPVESQPARLVILINPVIAEQPLNQTAVVGDNVIFSVMVTGTPPLGFRWKKNGLAVTPVSLQGKPTLTLTNVQLAHAGLYSVLVTNPASPSGIASSNATLTVLADSDHDHIPDDWETFYGLNPNDPSDAGLDPDGDTMTNWQEYIAGTDPTNRLSYLKVDAIASDPGGTRISFSAVSNKTYTVQFKEAPSVGRWTRLADVPSQPSNRVERVVDPYPQTGERLVFLDAAGTARVAQGRGGDTR